MHKFNDKVINAWDYKRLIEFRVNTDITQLDLSTYLGVTTNTIYRWERGMHKIPKPIRLLLCYMAVVEKYNG